MLDSLSRPSLIFKSIGLESEGTVLLIAKVLCAY